MSKQEYINKIVELLEKCSEESLFIFVKGVLERQLQ